jgi:hypothetical protein
MFKHTTLLALLTLAAGCTGSGLGSVSEFDIDESGARVLDGSPEALGMIAFLNAPSTTYEMLDKEVGLDRRAAESLIAHRNGPDGELGWLHDDLFDSVAEIDGCYYVGTRALGQLEQWALDNGWVALSDHDELGTWDGVTFTVAEAEATVELANTAGANYLDDGLDLDRRAVDSILAARPIDTVQELAGLYYVGQTALQTLKDTAASAPDCDKPGWDTEYIYNDGGTWRERLPAEYVAIVDEALDNDAWCGEASGQPWFVKATVDRFECNAKGYTIELGQGMAEYPSISWYIEFEVTETYSWFHSTCEV